MQGLQRGVEMDVFVVGWLCWQRLVSRLGFPPVGRQAQEGARPHYPGGGEEGFVPHQAQLPALNCLL